MFADTDAIGQLTSRVREVRALVAGSLNHDEIYILEGTKSDDGAYLAKRKRTSAGGHAGNSAFVLAELGAKPSILAAVGSDDLGSSLIEDLRMRGVDTEHIVRSLRPTGHVVIPVFDNEHFMIVERGANDDDAVAEALDEELLAAYDALVLTDPSLAVLEKVVSVYAEDRALPPLYWIPGGIYASHPVFPSLFRVARCIFVNATEAALIRHRFPGLLESEPASAVIETKGAEGASYAGPDGIVHAGGFKTTAIDPTGAGDTFSAVYVAADLAGLSIKERLIAANMAGRIAVMSVGARPEGITFHRLQTGLQKLCPTT